MPGAQSLVNICAACWKRPGLLGWELLWRWSFGLPACALVWHQARKLAVSLNTEGLTLSDPMQAAQQLLVLASGLTPVLLRTALWLGPVLALLWAVVSGLGRTAVLKSLDPTLHTVPLTMVLLQLLRIAALVAVCASWYRALRWAAEATLMTETPNLVAYSAWVICLSLGIFILWALLSWIFSIAPLLAMIDGASIARSLAHTLRLGPMTPKLVEVNLILSVVRLALIVLAMVFSAIPLPFVADMAGLPLYLWWAAVTLLYLVASDFFQVARLAAFLQLCRQPSDDNRLS